MFRNYESYKLTTLEEAGDGLWAREVVLDAPNWLPDESTAVHLCAAERILRELEAEGLVELRHAKSGVRIPSTEFDHLFRSCAWVAGDAQDIYGDAEFFQTEQGKRAAARLRDEP